MTERNPCMATLVPACCATQLERLSDHIHTFNRQICISDSPMLAFSVHSFIKTVPGIQDFFGSATVMSMHVSKKAVYTTWYDTGRGEFCRRSKVSFTRDEM